MSLELVLPGSVETFECQVPGCGENFYHRHRYLRHVPQCAARHRERLIEESERHAAEVDADPFQRVWDPEALEWVQKRIRDRNR